MTKKATSSRSSKAGLEFPVGRVARRMRDMRLAKRVGDTAPVYLAAVTEYIVAELVELAGMAAQQNKKSRISPRHVNLAILNDAELSVMFKDCSVACGGVLPSIHRALVNRSGKK